MGSFTGVFPVHDLDIQIATDGSSTFAPIADMETASISIETGVETWNVETVVQLVRKNPDTHIDFEISLDEFDLTAAESKATYQEIKDYVLDKFGLKISTLYISQVKAKCGIIERENYNKGEGKSRVPQCPKEKEDAIMDALRHFRMV